MPIQVPSAAQGAFNGTMQSSSKVELPFPAPAFYVLNGDPKLEELKNIMYFGGFAASVANVKSAAEQWENCPYPIPGFAEKDLTQGGKKVPSVLSRALIVSPIGMRQFSTITDPSTKNVKRVAAFTKGARPALQVLVYLGYRGEDKAIRPWAPALITAKGYQVNHIQRAFSDWKKAIQPFMGDIAPGMPADVTNLFWMHIGTFGQTANFEQHGDSQITPVSAFIPDDLDAKKVENLYVGDGVAEYMASLVVQSQEWREAYKNITPATAMVDEQASVEIPPEDDIPF
jgi:hypothetical protein